MIGYGHNISGLRTLFQPAHQSRVIADIVAAVKSSDVDGVNIDFEPETDVHDHANNPTVADGVAFSDFLQALGKALHALPGRRRQLSMDSESVSGACWSDSGEDQNPPHTWDLKPWCVPPQHGLSSDTIALINSDCGEMRYLGVKWP